MLGVRALAEYAICEFAELVEAPAPTPPDPVDPGEPPAQEPAPTPLSTVTQRYSTRSFTTRTSDTPADTFISKRMDRGLVVGRRLSNGPDGQFGSLIISSFGEIEFVNVDGGLDFLADDFFIDGRQIDLGNRQKALYAKYREKYRQLGIIKD